MAVVEHVVDVTLRISGPLYVAVACVLISCVAYVFFTVLLPLRYPFFSLLGLLHALTGITLVFNIFFNYFHCIFTNPGQPPATLVRS